MKLIVLYVTVEPIGLLETIGNSEKDGESINNFYIKYQYTLGTYYMN